MEQLGTFLPLILLVAVFWLFIIAPARRRQRDIRATQSAVGVGTDVMLASGIYGTVVGDNDDTLDVQIDIGVTVKVARQAVTQVITSQTETSDDERTGSDDI